MCVGYDPSNDEPGPYSDLDEYLCEYVDGEMEPAVRAAFEEYLRTDPALIAHVDHLREARAVLCQYGCRMGAPCGIQTRLHERLSREELQVRLPLPAGVSRGLGLFAGLASMAALLLIAGITVYDMEDPADVAAKQVVTASGWNSMHVLAPRKRPYDAARQHDNAGNRGLLEATLTGTGIPAGMLTTLSPASSRYVSEIALATAQPGLQQIAWVP